MLQRSPLKAESRQYRIYVANEDWRQRLYFIPHPKSWGIAYYYGFGSAAFMSGANFEAGRVVHWGYVGTPPRTLAALCAHELTHIIVWEHIGLARFRVPRWVWEGFPDYVAIDMRQSFEELRDALGDRPVDIPMMVTYGFYPRYRLLVAYFLGRKGWSVDQLLQTRLTEEEATAINARGHPGDERCDGRAWHRTDRTRAAAFVRNRRISDGRRYVERGRLALPYPFDHCCKQQQDVAMPKAKKDQSLYRSKESLCLKFHCVL